MCVTGPCYSVVAQLFHTAVHQRRVQKGGVYLLSLRSCAFKDLYLFFTAVAGPGALLTFDVRCLVGWRECKRVVCWLP
jgi:hypothetical protein